MYGNVQARKETGEKICGEGELGELGGAGELWGNSPKKA